MQVHELEIDYTTGCKPTDTSKGTDCSEYLIEVNKTLEPYPTCQCEWEFTLDEDFKVCFYLYHMYDTKGKLEKSIFSFCPYDAVSKRPSMESNRKLPTR